MSADGTGEAEAGPGRTASSSTVAERSSTRTGGSSEVGTAGCQICRVCGVRTGQHRRMSWYAETPALRSRQLLRDAAVLVWVVVWLRVGFAVHDTVDRLAAPGRALERAGRDLADGHGDAADRAGEVQQDAVGLLGVVLALVVAGLPVLLVLLWWLPSRLAFARAHAAARTLRADDELWALRAALHRSLPELAQLGPDAVGRWRRGEPGAAQALAELELRAAGLRTDRVPVGGRQL